ncbi:MAG: RNA polymerase sigma factor RpoH [Rickettsiales bacterium]|nr:RNA polymerase sigma factor RpoH [Rickettsiales bacterium]
MTAFLITNPTAIGKSADAGFLQYLREIQKFPILTAQEEYDYGVRFQKNGDKEAAKMLVQSHLRLVVKIARKFKNYGLPMFDIVAEGNVGLIQAVKKFDPTKGFRFSTYAMWWIRACIQEYVLRSWSLVKIGTTAAQKKLFFNLRKIKQKIIGSSASNDRLPLEHIEKIAQDLNVSQKDVIEMDSRLQQPDSSLNNFISDENDDELIHELASNDYNQEHLAIANQEKSRQENALKNALEILNEREKDILFKRQMIENPLTLEELSKIYQVSRERIRQIEENAINKIRKELKKTSA